MVYYMSHGRVAEAGTERSRREKMMEENPLLWTRSFAIMLVAVTVIAIAINFIALYQRERANDIVLEEEASKVIVIQARPSAAPTPSPTITSLRLLASGGELGEDGFTTYVEDRPIEITVEIEPKMIRRPPIYWSVSDEKAAMLTISEDGTSCKFSALKAAGKIELTVRCYGAETVIPVYLWER